MHYEPLIWTYHKITHIYNTNQYILPLENIETLRRLGFLGNYTEKKKKTFKSGALYEKKN